MAAANGVPGATVSYTSESGSVLLTESRSVSLSQLRKIKEPYS